MKVTVNNMAKLANFKLSRGVNDTTTSLQDENEIACWMAPEKLKHLKYPYDHKCEIFSFGMFLWELAFQKKSYEYRLPNEISGYVIDGGREKIKFGHAVKPEVTKIQEDYEKIIRKGKLLP